MKWKRSSIEAFWEILGGIAGVIIQLLIFYFYLLVMMKQSKLLQKISTLPIKPY